MSLFSSFTTRRPATSAAWWRGLALLALTLPLASYAQTALGTLSTSQTLAPGTYTFSLAAGQVAKLQGWGGGGSGGASYYSFSYRRTLYGGGGGGGAYATLTVTGPASYSVTVGTAGNPTSVLESTTVVLQAVAGNNAYYDAGGSGGLASANTPLSGAVSGGNGSNGFGAPNRGGDGGGPGGGAGGGNQGGSPGSAPGGGGGGSYGSGAGDGGAGRLTVALLPTLTGLNPTSGPVGTSVTLTGTTFTSGSTVSFNGTAATSITYNSATSLTAVVPAGATSGNVTVSTTGGTSNGMAFTVRVPPTLTGTSTNVTCNGAADGTASVVASGGVAPYTYSWNTSPAQTTTSISNLAPGTYTVTVTDNIGLSATRSYTITEPAVLTVGGSQTDVLCYGASTGVATAAPAGGNGSYTYSWDTSPARTTASITGLPAGTYTVTVKDGKNCTATRSYTIAQPTSALQASSAGQTDVLCYGQATGTASVAASGGTGSYTYTWSPAPGGGQGTATATGLAAGTYTVTVKDANNCTTTQSFIIGQPTAFITGTSQTNPSCNGSATGTATVSVGAGSYTYSWNTSPVQTTATATSLAAGTYTVSVSNGTCTETRNVTLTQPAALTLSGSQTSPTCAQPNGTATATPSGGTAPYTYSWNTSPVQTGATATGLVAGTYLVTVTDNKGCTATRSFTLTNTADTTPPVAAAKNVTVTLDATGTATLTGADVNNGSTDNCGVASLSVSRTSFTCANVGGEPNGGLRLVGTNSQYVLSNNAVSGTAGSATFETWLKTSTANGIYTGILVTSTVDGGSGGIYLRWNGGGRVACEGQWAVTQTAASAALNDGQWHHVAAVGDGTACYLYIDGVLNATGTVSAGAFSRRIMLGAERQRTAGYFSTMELDNSRVWSVARSQTQLVDGMNNNVPSNVTGLQLAYTYENGSGSTVSDVSGSSTPNPATLNPSGNLPTWTTTGALPASTPVTLTVRDAAGNQTTANARVTVLQPSAASTPALTWTGNTSTSWTDCGNWSYGLVPSASTTSIGIPAGRSNYPALSGTSLTVADLSIAAGASLNQGSTALLVTGNLSNAGPALTGAVSLTGTAAQAVAGSFSTLVVNKASGTTTLSANASVSTALTLTNGVLTTGSNTLTLGSTATLSETASSYVTGTVQTTRALSTATANTFGGLGLTLTPAAGSTMPGSTLVKRVTGTARTGISNRQGILRSFDIQPAVNTDLNVTLVFSYRDGGSNSELNGIPEASLALFKSETGAADSWGRQRNVSFDATANTATLAGVRDFSIWTLGNANAPLPVELAAFTAQAEGPAARLQWTTASEKNNAYFDVERSRDGREFATIGQQQGQGSKASATSYTFLDKQLPTGTTYYRLRQVDLDGTASYSPVRSVVMKPTTPERDASFTIYPTHAEAGQPLRYAYTGPALPANAALEVYDATGRCVRRQAAGAAAGLLAVKGLPTGWYWVRLQSTSGSQQARFCQP